jgi:hypothetical protein
MVRSALSSALVSALLLTGCGSRTLELAEDIPDGGTDAPASTSDTGGSTDDSGTTTDDGGPIVEEDGGTVPTDTGLPPTKDSGPPTMDASPPIGTISCGDKSCDPATQVCCVSFMGGQSCTAKGKCSGGIGLACTSAASCPGGEKCCFSGGGGGGGASCKASCGMGGPGSAQLCATDAECPMGQTCRNVMGGFKICRPAGGPGGP